MELRRVWAIYWSATSTTRTVVEETAKALAEALALPLERLDFTPPGVREQVFSFTEKDLVVLGMPTYAGRLPNKIAPFVKERLHGSGALAAGVVLFGNRSYDNSLAELCALLEGGGFHTVAAAAFVGRHAFTDELAYARPNWEDLAQARGFAAGIAEKVRGLTAPPEPVAVPGEAEAPYYVPKGTDGQPVNFLKAKPRTDLGRCNNCGVCARVCPMGAIDPGDVVSVPGICIKCQACVRRCTKRAKFFDDPAFLSHVAMLERTFTEPKGNEVFL